MQPAHRRHDISDHVWRLLEAHLPGRKGSWGGIRQERQQNMYQRSILDYAHECTVA